LKNCAKRFRFHENRFNEINKILIRLSFLVSGEAFRVASSIVGGVRSARDVFKPYPFEL
jgi:hypothetical protein